MYYILRPQAKPLSLRYLKLLTLFSLAPFQIDGGGQSKVNWPFHIAWDQMSHGSFHLFFPRRSKQAMDEWLDSRATIFYSQKFPLDIYWNCLILYSLSQMGIHPSTGHSPRHPFVTLGNLVWHGERNTFYVGVITTSIKLSLFSLYLLHKKILRVVYYTLDV